MKKTEAEEDNGSGSSPSSEDEKTAAIAKKTEATLEASEVRRSKAF